MSDPVVSWWPVFIVTVGTAACAALVAYLLQRFSRQSVDESSAQRQALIDRIDACLPQTQCAQCGYPGCRPYAEAMLDRQVGIDQCPPGGRQTIVRLAELLGQETTAVAEAPVQVARIDERNCIGCALCLPACPTDAIVGAHRLMHTVVAADCTGCELCLPPCPVDCIELVPVTDTPRQLAWSRTR